MKVGILGAGKMGKWLAKELAKNNKVCLLVRGNKSINIENVKTISKMSELKTFNPNFLINAVSLQNTIEAFKNAEKFVPKECVFVDIASIKNGLPDFYKEYGHRFVSVHPMFGPTFSNLKELENESAVIIKESDKEAKQFMLGFFKSLRVTIFEISFEEHDEMMAYSLTLPFVSTMVFAACLNSKTVPGTTFKKHLQIAKSLLSEDDNLLSEILFNPHSVKQLRSVTSRLEFLKHIIEGRDSEEAKKFFNSLRDNIR